MTDKFHLATSIFFKKYGKLITYGSFIFLFSVYVRPIIRQASYKNKCIDYVVEANLIEARKQNIHNFQNIDINKWALINAYRQCNNTSAN